MVAALPHELREVFVLVEMLGLRYREVASMTGVAEGTVKSRMFRARQELSRALTAPRTADDG
ncbi:MAG: sigma factor-like helix-turn-helix DNA-binding protein [Acidimicrobiales bacterium]